jgi:hypothetical protein
MNISKKLRWIGREASKVELSDVLGALGLQKKTSALGIVLPMMGTLVAGAVIGAGIGLLFAPASGRRTRQTVETRIGHLKEKITGHHAGHLANGLSSSQSTGALGKTPSGLGT